MLDIDAESDEDVDEGDDNEDDEEVIHEEQEEENEEIPLENDVVVGGPSSADADLDSLLSDSDEVAEDDEDSVDDDDKNSNISNNINNSRKRKNANDRNGKKGRQDDVKMPTTRTKKQSVSTLVGNAPDLLLFTLQSVFGYSEFKIGQRYIYVYVHFLY